MRPSEYDDDAIITAGKALEKEAGPAGRTVTTFSIRKRLGGGNAGRIRRVWEDYKKSQTLVESEPVQTLPPEVQEALDTMTADFAGQLVTLVTQLNQKAVNTAERRVAEVMNTAQREQQAAEQEIADATETVDDLEKTVFAQIQALREKDQNLSESEQQRKDLSRALTQAQQEHAVLSEKAGSLTARLKAEQAESEARVREIAQLEKTLEDLRKDKERLLADNQAMQAGKLEAEQKHTETLNALRKTEQEATELKGQARTLPRLEKSVEELRQEKKELSSSLKASQNNIVQFRNQLDQAKEQLHQTKVQRDQYATELKGANHLVATLQSAMDALNRSQDQ